MIYSDIKEPHAQEALTPSMGAMSRSYRARSGGLANEFCLLGREEVPSLLGDTVPLNKLVMLWQLLGSQDEGRNQAHPPSLWLPAGPHSMPARLLSYNPEFCTQQHPSLYCQLHNPRVLVLYGTIVLFAIKCSHQGK